MPHSLTVRQEPLSVLIRDGLEDLAYAHWKEIELDGHAIPFALDLAAGYAAERAGALRVFSFRRDGALFGYASFSVGSFHARGTLQAFLDAIYVRPDMRGLGACAWRKAEAELRRLGFVRIIADVPLHTTLRPERKHGTVARLFEALGYRPFGMTYSKLLRG